MKSKYHKHAVGEHVVPYSLTFHADDIVSEILTRLKEKADAWPDTEYLYITDSDGKLIGVVTFEKLLGGKPHETLDRIMNTRFSCVTDHTHQENAAKLAVAKGLETIPVTDINGHFLGILDAKQIFTIMHEIHIEKLMHFSGVIDTKSLQEGYKTKIGNSVMSRLPSLIIGLVGGFLSISIIESFQETLANKLLLAFFIPVIVYMNAAVGTQIQTIYVRFSALEKVHLRKAFIHEFFVTCIIGCILSSLMFLFAFFWYNDPTVATIVFVSMFIGIASSVCIGIFIPWGLQKSGYDPAIGSGPFTTILQDLLSIFIYFSIASLFI